MDEQAKLALKHAWDHFSVHAGQRISVFNFFVATAGLLVTGIGYTLQASHELWPLGTAAGLLLVVLAFVFRKLDGRVSAIFKSSEAVIVDAEALLISDPKLRAVSRERQLSAVVNRGVFGEWTYGRSFRFIFILMSCVGLVGAAWSLSRAPLPTFQVVWPATSNS